MKKAIIILLVIVLVLAAAAVFPIPHVSYDDGGTREFTCLSRVYKLVRWNKLLVSEETPDIEVYHHWSFFGYPDSDKPIDELWKLERESEYYKKAVGTAEYGEIVAGNDSDFLSLIITEADFDIDGDGETEHCTITPGPTYGLFSICFTAHSQDGDGKFEDGFILDWGSLEFETVDGKTMLRHGEHYHDIVILDGHVSLPTDCEDCMLSDPVEWQE